MMLSLFRNGALRRGKNSRRRIAIARTPRLESLEDRKLPAVLVLPITSLPAFTITLTLPGSAGGNTVGNVPVAGGNFLGTYNTTTLSSSYGLSPQLGMAVGVSYYSASENSNGTIYGTAVPNAGSIAWLVSKLGPTATTADAQDALQAAIWQVEFGNDFGLDSSNNATLIADFEADLTALGNNTLPVSDVMWINPDSTETFPLAQVEGLVALPATTPDATATFVTASANPARKGKAVNFSVTVLADQSSVGAVIPLGTVVFKIDGKIKASVQLSNGKAVLDGIKLAVGTHTVTVYYTPLNATFAASQGELIGGETIRK
jgi:hypothetical protein